MTNATLPRLMEQGLLDIARNEIEKRANDIADELLKDLKSQILCEVKNKLSMTISSYTEGSSMGVNLDVTIKEESK